MTKKEQILTIMKDKEWHCCVCEFGSSQPAAIFRDLRNDGYKFEEDPNRQNQHGQFTSVKKCVKNVID